MLYRRVHGECLVDLVLMAIDDDPSAKMMSLSDNHRVVAGGCSVDHYVSIFIIIGY